MSKKNKILVNQIENVVKLLENEYETRPLDMLKLIIKRYKRFSEIVSVNDNITAKDFVIKGSVRAFLDVRSDYDNPILKYMSEIEESGEKLLT